jgi:hypothetical protein
MSAFDFIAAADTTNMQAGGESLFGGVTDFVTKGAVGAVVSGMHGLYNTGVDLSNNVFGTEIERADTAETLGKIDSGYAEYYETHKEAVDVAGFVAGSLIPGTLAVKGLKLIQGGQSAGAFGRVLGFASSREQKYLAQALTELSIEGGTVFTRINQAKMTSMAWGTADMVLQTAAFETAGALAMKSSPMLDNEDWRNIGWDIVKTSLAGGVLGGGIGALFTNKFVKDVGKRVEGKQRLYDVLAQVGEVDLKFGDKAFSIVDALMALPKEVIDPIIKLPRKVGDLSQLDLTPLLTKSLQKTTQDGLLKLRDTLTNVVGNDTTVGTPFAASLLSMVKQGMEKGINPEAIRAKLGDYLLNLTNVEGIGARALDVSGELRYLDPAGQVDISGGNIFSSKMGSSPSALIYRVVGDESMAKMATLGKDALTKEEAYKNGFDFVLDPKTKGISISPDSAIYKQIDAQEAAYAPLFYNVSTTQTSLTTVPTIADLQTVRNPLTVNASGVLSGSKSYTFKLEMYEGAADSVEATARHLWASKQMNIGGKISKNDISVLENLLLHPNRAAEGLVIVDPVTKAEVFFKDIHDFRTFVFNAKYDGAISLLERLAPVTDDAIDYSKVDLRDIAYRLNVQAEWLEKAVGVKFDRRALYNDPGWVQEMERYEVRDNLILRYDTKAVKEAALRPDALAAYHYRVKEATEKSQVASAAVLGEDNYKLLMPLDKSLAIDANSQTVGASMLGSSNANYTDPLRSWAQYSGQIVGQITNKRVTEALSGIQSPAAKLLQNPAAAAEVAAAVTSARLSTQKWSLWVDEFTGNFALVDTPSYQRIMQGGGKITFANRIDLSKDAGDFLAAHHGLHAKRVDQQKVLAAAQGTALRWDPDVIHFPPVDTQRIPFFAFVRQTDGTMFGSSEVAMVTARDAAELQAKTAQIEKIPGMSVIYKKDTEAYHKAKGDFDIMRAMNEPVLDSTLRKQGLLGDYLPNMTPEAVVNDFVQYIQRAETKLVRDAVGANYAQTIAELQALSDRYTAGQTSKFQGLTKFLQGSVTDPFGDAIKLAMNVSKRGEFTLWHQANEFVDALGTRGYRGIEKATLDARGGQITWEAANEQLEKFGLGAVFKDEDAFAVAQSAPDRNLIKTAFQKANMLLANSMLRLDFANSILNIISTPILLGTEVSAIRNSLKNDPQMAALFQTQVTELVPRTEVRIPSTTRLIANAIGALVPNDQSKALMARFREIGTVKGPTALFHDMVDDLSLMPNLVPNKYAEKVEQWVEKGASLTFSNQAEDATRFVTSHVMWQLTEPVVKAGKMSVQEQNAFISIFTNRVQGNYIAAQRPILFQGTLGSAIGLFQTYQFNLFQQLFRHIENKDLKTVATMGALQGTLFGANGLPLFDAINTHIVGSASINEKHKDAYSYAVQAVGKDFGDWMMYGTASAFPLFSEQAPALYTRGDLNPRSVFVVPTSPLDVPAVSASLKVIGAVLGAGKRIVAGADISDALLFGLEHNGVNRPLAGLAQVMQGHSTTSKGNLIASASDWDSMSTAARLIGAKPMDESIALNTMYRSRAYQAMDKERIDELGLNVKNKMRGNEPLTAEDFIDFQGKYAASGGRIQGYSQAIQRWNKAANTSIVNEVMRHSQTAAGQRMNEVLGGDPLQDYRNSPPEADDGT